MRIKTIKISGKGQIAIPLEIRRDANMHEGDELVVIQKGGKLLLEKADEFADQIEFSDLAKFSEKSLKSLWGNKENEVWNSRLGEDS